MSLLLFSICSFTFFRFGFGCCCFSISIEIQIQCKVHDNESGEIDLTPLKSTEHNYLARINDTMKSKQPTGVLVSYNHKQCPAILYS